MKKIIACLLILCMMACVFCACADDPADDTDTSVQTNGNADTDEVTDDDTAPEESESDEPTEPVEETFDLGTESPDPEGDGNYTPNY